MTYHKFSHLCEKQVQCDNGFLLLLTGTSAPLLANQLNGESLQGVGVIAACEKNSVGKFGLIQAEKLSIEMLTISVP